MLDFYVDYFIKTGGLLPSDRYIIENSNFEPKEINEMRRKRIVETGHIRELAIQKTGRTDFIPSQKRRIENGKITRKHNASLREPKKIKEKKSAGRPKKFHSREECIEILKQHCATLGYIPTQLEIRSEPEIPAWETLNNYIGPWYTWDKVTGYPFASPKVLDMARRATKKSLGI